jgi:transcriptional regulator with XRE-family HTH domain
VETSPRIPRLRAVREAKGLSLREAARRAQTDPTHLSRIERGLRQPTIPLLLRLSRALDLHNVADSIERLL